MPTGYTAGILDGSITNFPEFAKICMRAMGATIMMRDEPLDAPWQPREPGDYYQKNIDQCKKDIAKYESATDSEILEMAKSKLSESKSYNEKKIAEAESGLIKLNEILSEVDAWKPPTEDHKGVKKFMINQLQETIEWDGDVSYHQDKLKEINQNIESLDAETERSSAIAESKKNLAYYESELQKEIERCEKSNEWVRVFLDSTQPK